MKTAITFAAVIAIATGTLLAGSLPASAHIISTPDGVNVIPYAGYEDALLVYGADSATVLHGSVLPGVEQPAGISQLSIIIGIAVGLAVIVPGMAFLLAGHMNRPLIPGLRRRFAGWNR